MILSMNADAFESANVGLESEKNKSDFKIISLRNLSKTFTNSYNRKGNLE